MFRVANFPAASRVPCTGGIGRLVAAVSCLLVVSLAPAEEVRVTSTPTGATIVVNDQTTNMVTPATVDLQAGDTVRLEADGHEVVERKIESPVGRIINLELTEITSLRLFLDLKTSNRRNAGTDDLSVVVLLNGDPAKRRVLGRRNQDNFRVGAVESYSFDFDCPTRNLKGLQIRIEAGDDAWHCEGVVIRMEKGDALTTKPISRVLNQWFCADTKKGTLSRDILFGRVRFEPIKIPLRPFNVTVPANRNRLNPVKIGRVNVGDTVTIAPVSGRWSGGGSRQRQFCDWQGYSDNPDFMALHVAVGDLHQQITEPTTRFVVRQAGALSLYANDKDPRGNVGAVLVSVEVTQP